jgi:hypothetical protein
VVARKWQASILSVVMVVAVAAPVAENWKATPRDDFPLSYYPMFSFERADRQRVTYLVGYDAGGARHELPYRYAGQGGMNQVRRQIGKMLERGQGNRLCQMVATRVARAGSEVAALRRVEIVTGTFQLSSFYGGSREPVSENVRARCTVRRAS